MLNKSFYIVLAGAVMAVSGANAAGTQVQTVQSTERAYEPVESRLSTVTTQVDGIITTTGTQKTDITGLLRDKHNRPDESCEEGKNCLLVKDASGTEHWYPIVDCGEDAFLGNVGNYEAITINGQTYQGVRNCSGTSASALGCNAGEIVQSYHNGIVFIEEIGLNIAETQGTVVSLAPDVTGESGEAQHHLCRVTGYRVKNSDGTLQARHNVDTNMWIVDDTRGGTGGNCYRYITNNSNVMTYYETISNSCSAPAPEAQMCLYHTFFTDVYNNGVSETNLAGMVEPSGAGVSSCQSGGYFASNPHCSTPNTWIAGYSNEGNGSMMGYVYGTAAFANVPTGTVAGSVVDVDLSDISSTCGENMVSVCIVQGYKAAGASTETNVSFGKVYVASTSSCTANSNVGTRLCMDAAGWPLQDNSLQIMPLYNALGNMCVGQ